MCESRDPRWMYRYPQKKSEPHPAIIFIMAAGGIVWLWLVMCLLDALGV